MAMYNVTYNQKQTGDNIRYYREVHGWSQSRLASAIKKTESSVRKYEAGLVEIPLSVIADICTVLRVAPLEILEFVEVSE